MNFSLDWFLTIPGLLITGGVLLLLIALIILIATSRKKKDNTSANAESAVATPESTPVTFSAVGVLTGVNSGMNSPAPTSGTIMDMPAPVGTAPVSDTNINMNMGMNPTAPSTGI